MTTRTNLDRAMQVSDDLQRAILYAGLLHDVGVPMAAVPVSGGRGIVFALAPTGDLRAAEETEAAGRAS